MGGNRFLRALATAAWYAHPAPRGRAYRFLQRSQWLSPEELEHVQLAALNRVLAAAHEIPFYAERLAAASIGRDGVRSLEELATLEPLERADLQHNGIAGLRRRRGVVIRRSTSGTTGEPVAVVWPLEMMIWVDTVERRSQQWLGIGVGDRGAYVQARSSESRRASRLKRSLKNRVRIDLGSLEDPQSRDALLRGLGRNPPAFVVGNAPAVHRLALALEDRWTFDTRIVVTSGARLDEHQRTSIERVFRCPVYERYGTIETGLLSHPCREGGLQHVPAEAMLLEIVRDDGRPPPAGDVGHVLVTCLRNRAMPLIRYRLGDLASLGVGLCPCGRGLPVLERFVGRTIDRLVNADGGIVLPEVVVRTVLAIAEPSVLEFKIVQQQDRRVEILLVQRDDPEPEPFRTRLAHVFDGLVGMPGTTVVERVPHIPVGPGGKLSVVVSHAVEPDGTPGSK